MPLIGIIAKKKDVQAIKNKLLFENYEIIEINEQSIRNFKNIQFDEIVFLKDINLQEEEYIFMKNIISKVQYLIMNADVNIEIFNKIEIVKPIKLITFGFNSKATITISSIKEEKIIICLQRNIQKSDNEIIESQEKEMEINKKSDKKIYNELAVFIIKELHNLPKNHKKTHKIGKKYQKN